MNRSTIAAIVPTVLLAVGCATEVPQDAAPPEQTVAGPSSVGAALPGGGLSVREASGSSLEGPLLVNGYLVSRSGAVRLCAALSTTEPPTCEGPSLELEGADIAGYGLERRGDVAWTQATVSILGTVEGEKLAIDPTSI